MAGNYTEQLNRLTAQYNGRIRALEDAYDMENASTVGWNLSSAYLVSQYSKRYEAIAREYYTRRRQLSADYKRANPEWARWRAIWQWVFVAGVMAAVVCCGAALPADETAPAALTRHDVAWSAENIPIPYLKDKTQYVSNPDSVLSPGAVSRMNRTLQRMESELGVQSVVIVVNHIANDDPFRMAQDVGNRYGVGIDDRGLVIVVGYEDHSINMSPGRALEADLTDAECHRLEQRYVVPAMRAEMPDSGMIYLTEAVYSTLQKKELPDMSRLTSRDDDIDDQTATAIGLTFLFLTLWGIVFLRLNQKYQWMGLLGVIPLTANPFHVESSSGFSGGGFGGFGGGSGGGGGFSGGSFGGGSFGGGGATSRW